MPINISLRGRYAALVATALLTSGCTDGGEPVGPQQVAYRCTETQEFVLAAPQPHPAVNPKTGRSTLMRTLYCPECEKWHVVPPPEVYNGHPVGFLCPLHQSAMQETGPLPDS